MSRSMAGGGAARAGVASGVLLSANAVRMAAAILTGIAVAADVHVEGCRTGAQQMIVDGGDLERRSRSA